VKTTLIDLRRRRFGRWRVIRRVVSSRPAAQWLCVCTCGVRKVVSGIALREGSSKSCGCLRRELCAAWGRIRMLRHGKSRTPEYRAWIEMWQRCTSTKKRGFDLYGGRGIRVQARWRKFENFFADIGRKPTAAHSLDRKDTNGNYGPKNCRWATRKEQQRNRRDNRMVTAFRRIQPLRAWAEERKIHPNTLDWRLQHGWTPEEALRTASGAKRS
jgi:hypothetical protein